MKRIVILIVLVALAAVAGVVRSSVGSVAELREIVSHKNAADVRQEIRQSYELAPGARVGPYRGMGRKVIEPVSAQDQPLGFQIRRRGAQDSIDPERGRHL